MKLTTSEKIALAGLIIGILACIGTYLTVPEVREMIAKLNDPNKTALVTPTPTGIPKSPQPALASWEQGALVYQENFENDVAKDWRIAFGDFKIIRASDGNHVWRTENNGIALLTLPTASSDYTVQVRVMQVAGEKGLGIVHIRLKLGRPCNASYQTYIDTSVDWLTLVEKDTTCDELRKTGLFAARQINLLNGAWYTLRIDAKGTEVRVYLDGNLLLRGTSNTLQSNMIGLAACCNDSTHIFDFDDIQVWSIKP